MSLLTKSSILPSAGSLFNDFFNDDRFMSFDWGNGWSKVPSANVIEKDNLFQIEMAVPCMKKNDFHVDINNGQLTISSEKKEEKEDKEESYTRKEFSYTSFSRSFFIPDNVDAEKIKAKYEDGILMLDLPKKEITKVSKKEIQVG